MLVVLAVAGIGVFFWNGIGALLSAWDQPEYSHGYLIPLIAAYLLLLRLREASTAAPQQSTGHGLLGLTFVLVGLVTGLVGNLVAIPDVVSYGLVVCLAGLVLLWARTASAWPLAAPLAYLIFMIPLPNFIYWPLSIKLQIVSSTIGVAFIKLFGVPVLLEGNVIDLGIYKLQVAEACSGLRYLFPLASFGFLFAVLYKGPFWHKLVLFLSSMPITILMNSFRIGVIGLLVDRYGIEQAEGFLHFFEGWVIFAACFFLLIIIAVLLQRLCSSPQPIHGMLEFDPGALVDQLGRLREIRPTGLNLAGTAVIVASALAWYASPGAASVTAQRSPFILFPQAIQTWAGKQLTLERSVERVLAADDYLLADYRSPDATAPVNLFSAYYRSLTTGGGIHSPEVCIPVGGWEVFEWKQADTGIAYSNGETLKVNRAIIQKGLDRQIVYYWFEQRGRHLTSDYAAKFYTVLDSIKRGRTDGALVRVTTPITRGESMEAADARLRTFLITALAELPEYIPH